MRKFVALLMILMMVGLAYGNKTTLDVTDVTSLSSARGPNKILIKFSDLPEDLTSESRILKAELSLNLDFELSSRDAQGIDIKVLPVNREWSSESISRTSFYSHPSPVDTSNRHIAFIPADSRQAVLDVTNYIGKWLSEGKKGILIKTFTEGADLSAPTSGSREEMGSLEIIYSPDRRER